MIPAIRAQDPLPDTNARFPMANSWVVGIFSHSEHRAKQFADRHQIPHTFVNLADLLAHPDVQCVYISSHPRHHRQATLAALAAGKHVLCETPLALSLDDALTMTHTALNRGLWLGLNYIHRGDPALRVLRDMLANRAIGDVLGGRVDNTVLLRTRQQTWRLRQNGGGVILDRMLHDIDMLRFLLRDEIGAIHTISTQQILGNEVEEDVLTHLKLRRSGLHFQLHDSFIIPHSRTGIEINGSTGTLLARDCFDNDLPSELVLLRHGQETRVSTPQSDPHKYAVQMFNSAIRHSGQPLATGTDGVHSLAVTLAAIESIRRGQRVTIPDSSPTIIARAF